MAEPIVTKRELEQENEALKSENAELLSVQERLTRMEALVQEQKSSGTYKGPKPKVYFDPFDVDVNPLTILKNPAGKVLGWKNPNLRNGSRGWRGWVPITYDSEIGQHLNEYINDPPAKLDGTATQDNYVRRGTDSILCWIDEDIFKARQQKREQKALAKQLAASGAQNSVLREGVSTFGDGVRYEERPAGGFKVREDAPPLVGEHAHRTAMFASEE
jgi:hypothetical protein